MHVHIATKEGIGGPLSRSMTSECRRNASTVAAQIGDIGVYWINGKSALAQERHIRMKAMLDRAGIASTRVPAVYPDELSALRKQGLDLAAFDLVPRVTVRMDLRDGCWRM